MQANANLPPIQFDGYPELAGEQAKLDDLVRKRKACDDRLREIEKANGTALSSEWAREAVMAAKQGKAVDVGAGSRATFDAIELAFKEARILDEAIALQREDRDNARIRAAREICAAWTPEYSDRIRAVAKAALALLAAIRGEREIFRAFNDAGVPPCGPLRFLDFHPLGGPQEVHGSRLNLWFRDAIEAGLLTRDDIPEDLRKTWAL